MGCDIVSATKTLKGKISYIFLTILVFCVFTVDFSTCIILHARGYHRQGCVDRGRGSKLSVALGYGYDDAACGISSP